MHRGELDAYIDQHGTVPVAAADGKAGCPVERWDGPYRQRCGMGIDNCYLHGKFELRTPPGVDPPMSQVFGDTIEDQLAEQRERMDAALRIQLNHIPEPLWPFAVVEYPPSSSVDFGVELSGAKNTVTLTTTTPVPRVRVHLTQAQFDRWNNLRAVTGQAKCEPEDLSPFWRVVPDDQQESADDG